MYWRLEFLRFSLCIGEFECLRFPLVLVTLSFYDFFPVLESLVFTISPMYWGLEFLRIFFCTGDFLFTSFPPVLETLSFYDFSPELDTLSFYSKLYPPTTTTDFYSELTTSEGFWGLLTFLRNENSYGHNNRRRVLDGTKKVGGCCWGGGLL